jgi:opacity protein-like surface antigen
VKRLFFLLVLAFAMTRPAHAQQASVISGFLGAQFFDTDAPLETSPVLGLRWAWIARNGHGFEVTIDYTETRVEVGQLTSLLGLSFGDPQTMPEQLQRIAVDYAYVGRGGVVRPYVTAGVGFLDASLVLSNRAERILATLNRQVDTHDSSVTYEAGAGVLVGEDRLRFRYDMRIIYIDQLFTYGGTTTYQATGGISWVF